MIDLTPATTSRLEALFSAADATSAARMLRDECADLPLWNAATPKGLERVRFAVLKLSAGRLDRLARWVREAQIDWRDVLVAAGFAEDVDAHRSWHPDA